MSCCPGKYFWGKKLTTTFISQKIPTLLSFINPQKFFVLFERNSLKTLPQNAFRIYPSQSVNGNYYKEKLVDYYYAVDVLVSGFRIILYYLI